MHILHASLHLFLSDRECVLRLPFIDSFFKIHHVAEILIDHFLPPGQVAFIVLVDIVVNRPQDRLMNRISSNICQGHVHLSTFLRMEQQSQALAHLPCGHPPNEGPPLVPILTSISPFCSKIRNASSTVLRLTPSCFINSRSGGSLSPGLRRSERIASSI